MFKITNHVLDFLHFHYLSKRNDTEFWSKFKERTASTDFVNKFKEISKRKFPMQGDYDYINLTVSPTTASLRNNTFSLFNWHMVGAGIGYFDPNIADRDLQSYLNRPSSSKTFDANAIEQGLKELLEFESNNTFDHHEYIEYLKNNES